jgi:2-dehydropantoate 2-reductase
MQNGVDNADRVRAATGIDALAAVVYVAAEMTAPGEITHKARGDLIVGQLSGEQKDTPERITELFTSADVPCRASEQIRVDLWHKLVMNSAYNAISALSRASYGAIAEHALASEVADQVIREAVAVAHADGIDLPLESTLAAGPKLARMIGAAFSSTAQDIERGKLTEIDSLNGYIVRRGRELGLPTPVNQTLHALVRLLEQGRAPI